MIESIPVVEISPHVVIVAEKDPGNCRILLMEVIELEQVTHGQTMLQLIKPRQRDPEPGAAAFTPGHENPVGQLQLAIFFLATQTPLDGEPL